MTENQKRSARFTRIGCFALALTTASAGCASIVNGTRQKVSFSSDPPGASVIVDGTEMGTTPTEVALARDQKHSVRIEKAGYVAYESALSTTFHDEWTLVPLVFFLEQFDPGAYDLSPKEVKARLIGGPSAPTP